MIYIVHSFTPDINTMRKGISNNDQKSWLLTPPLYYLFKINYNSYLTLNTNNKLTPRKDMKTLMFHEGSKLFLFVYFVY